MTALGVNLPPVAESREPLGQVLLGSRHRTSTAPWRIEVAEDAGAVHAYHQLRRDVFVAEQELFTGTDLDRIDEDPRAVVLLARTPDGTVLGGVRLAPATPGVDIGWWVGGRLAVLRSARAGSGVGSALVRAACAHAEARGAIRFDATVQAGNERWFTRLGWSRMHEVTVAGSPHVLMGWPVGRFAALAHATKAPLGELLAGMHLGGAGYVGDDGAPVPGSDLIAACDAIVPAMVERDPEWAGWCAVLVNLNDLAAMGAVPVGLLDSLGARDVSFAARVISGLRRASAAYGVPILGGHTQFGVPASLSVTALGRTSAPIPAGGGRVGHTVSLTADLAGSWRRGQSGRQWDSTTGRTGPQLQDMLGVVARARPSAAKDVSMAGIAGTLGMLAEASGCGAVLDVAAVPHPPEARMGDWLSCFPGFAMLTADRSDRPMHGTALTTTAACGELVPGRGVSLRWPDGQLTSAVPGSVTGLGRSGAIPRTPSIPRTRRTPRTRSKP